MDDNLRQEIKEHIKEHEGFSKLAYECPHGFITIAWGRNLETTGINKDEAEILLDNDVNDCIADLKRVIKNFDNMPGKAQLVLIDLVYNMGLSKLLGFENFLDSLECGKYEEAAEHLLDSKYARQLKRRSRINASYIISCSEE
jgi:lysozyme